MGQAVDLIAAVSGFAQRLAAVVLRMDQGFDLMMGMVIVLEMCSPEMEDNIVLLIYHSESFSRL